MDTSTLDREIAVTNIKQVQVKPQKVTPKKPETAHAAKPVVLDIHKEIEKASEPTPVEKLRERQKFTEDLDKLIEKFNNSINNADNHFKYSIHEKTKKVVIKMIDSKTGDVVREFPPESTLDNLAKMLEQAGIFIDKKG
ncbi:hypothetical protein AGMMS49975_02550 [Clostridia bacterium]|nr:hypothetical protein AGMMS49975_02550 [Clostridia bacterium]